MTSNQIVDDLKAAGFEYKETYNQFIGAKGLTFKFLTVDAHNAIYGTIYEGAVGQDFESFKTLAEAFLKIHRSDKALVRVEYYLDHQAIIPLPVVEEIKAILTGEVVASCKK
jgi:hypothetical protein